MSNATSTAVRDQLYRLVSNLTKAEKRNFKVFARRGSTSDDALFVQLFDLMDAAPAADDAAFARRLGASPGKYANLKRHLYAQLLTSLRLIYIKKEIDIELRQQIDFSLILYGKGLYLDALRLLERGKEIAKFHNRDVLHLEILEFTKLIEARHSTGSRQVSDKLEHLVNESAERGYTVLNSSELFSMNIQIHGHYITEGHSQNPEETHATEAYWERIRTQRPDEEAMRNTFHQRLNRHQGNMWYRYIQVDFAGAYAAATEAVSLYDLRTQMTVKDPDLYVRCLYYAGMFAYLCGDHANLDRKTRKLAKFMAANLSNLKPNSRNIGGVYLSLLELNGELAAGNWAAARRRSEAVAARWDLPPLDPAHLDPEEHRRCLFEYKHAAACFMLGDYDCALDLLNDILNRRSGLLRDSLQIHARLLYCLSLYQLGRGVQVEYNLGGLSRILRRSRHTTEVHRLTAAALRKLLKSVPAERPAVFHQLGQDLAAVAGTPLNQKALLFLDVRRWVSRNTEITAPAAPPR